VQVRTLRHRSRFLATVLVFLALVGGFLSAVPLAAVSSATADAATLTTVTITGHGYGHGRGMGQYGAYGYALPVGMGGQAWTYQQILSYYYGGTTLTPISSTVAAQSITVQLDEFDSGAALAAGPSGTTAVTEYGTTRYYLGMVSKTSNGVFDVVGLDQYVAGVVPAESPASWGINGLAALEAQAVAARSYALAEVTANPSQTICDTTACQVYDGDPDIAGSPTNSAYTTYSDQAVSATEGQVLDCGSDTACGSPGQVALTEFSSSTGGYTAGGAFPAVADGGDGVAAASNPNHAWTTTVSAAAVQSAYPSIGTLTSLNVISRNGDGDMGGRVLTMSVAGTAGSVTTTGNGFAAALGLRSNWFSFNGSTGASGGDNGYWVVGSDGSVNDFGAAPSYGSMAGKALNGPVVAMAPTADQAGYWLVGSDGGIFTFGDATFYGSTGSMKLNKPVLGMASTPDGRGYWLVASDGGIFTFGDAGFYGSTGSLKLNAPIVGMAATPDGRGYWLVASDGGIFTFGDAGFYGSTGSLKLNAPIVGMVPTADGRGYTLIARDGGVFTFGDASFEGSLPGLGIAATVAGVTPTADGGGYLAVSKTGTVYPFGDAPTFGSMSDLIRGWSGTAIGIFAHKGS
jgi:SpoIID/LytB domain protein